MGKFRALASRTGYWSTGIPGLFVQVMTTVYVFPVSTDSLLRSSLVQLDSPQMLFAALKAGRVRSSGAEAEPAGAQPSMAKVEQLRAATTARRFTLVFIN